MHLEIGFCENFCVQVTFLIPGTIKKCSWGKEHPFLTEFVLIMTSFFIQYNAPLVEYVNVVHEINSFCQKWLIFCQFQINFIIFELKIVSLTVHDNFQPVCISLEILFPCQIKFSGSSLFRNHSQNARTVSLESFVYIPFASTVPSNRSWRTRRHFTPLLSLASLSTYAKSIHQSSFLNLANAFMRLNLRVARVNFV